MAIYSWFSHEKMWISIAMLVLSPYKSHMSKSLTGMIPPIVPDFSGASLRGWSRPWDSCNDPVGGPRVAFLGQTAILKPWKFHEG